MTGNSDPGACAAVSAFRIAPPLTIDAGEIDLGLEIFDRTLARPVH